MNTNLEVSRRTLLATAAATAVTLSGAVGAQTPVVRAAQGKVALVTGSSRGIGAATARRLARDGYAVTVNSEADDGDGERVVSEIQSAGGRAQWVRADVRDPRAVQRLFESTQQAFGGVDVVVSNAGVMRLASFREMTDANFDLMLDVNQRGSFNVLREAARRVRDGGRIITLSSSITQLRSVTYGPYAATKAAMELFANVLAKELEGRMISVNAVAPGVVNTPLFTDGKTPEQIAGFAARTPLKRLGEPTDIADAISALCSSDGQWINGQTVFVNGGIV